VKTESFDVETAREFLGTERSRYFEQLAAKDVEADRACDIFRILDARPATTYQQELVLTFETIVYRTAYDTKLKARARRNQVFEIDEALMSVVRTVVEQQAKAFEQYCAGNEKAVGAIIGAVMKIQRFDPKQVKQAVDSLKK
jgi:Asp-tRNA(Asn)/Glu-tRNA(Gln) amidotransferase B subunit